MRIKALLLSAVLVATAGICPCRAQKPEIRSQWYGAKVAFLGDSITDEGQATVNRNGVMTVLKRRTPVIDLASICGLYPLEPEHARYFREDGMKVKSSPTEAAAAKAGTEQALEHHDLLHPNTEGHLRMAYALAYQLLGYPSSFGQEP